MGKLLIRSCAVGRAAHQRLISARSSQCLNHPELPAAERSTQPAPNAQGKSTRGKRKRKKEQEHPKEERQEKGSRKTAGIPSSALPGTQIKDSEQTGLACFMLEEVGEHQGLVLCPDIFGKVGSAGTPGCLAAGHIWPP